MENTATEQISSCINLYNVMINTKPHETSGLFCGAPRAREQSPIPKEIW